MNDLNNAKAALAAEDFTCVFRKGTLTAESRQRGILPLLQFLSDGTDLRGYSAADRIVGRAAAFLYILLGVKAVYASVMSEAAFSLLTENGIAAEADCKVSAIRNRSNTGICPMEQTVRDIDDPKAAFYALQQKVKELSGQ